MESNEVGSLQCRLVLKPTEPSEVASVSPRSFATKVEVVVTPKHLGLVTTIRVASFFDSASSKIICGIWVVLPVAGGATTIVTGCLLIAKRISFAVSWIGNASHVAARRDLWRLKGGGDERGRCLVSWRQCFVVLYTPGQR